MNAVFFLNLGLPLMHGLNSIPSIIARHHRGPDICRNIIVQRWKSSNGLIEEATVKFEEGTKARATAHDYIQNTVFLATVLVLMAISQRFEVKSILTGLIILSFGLLSFGIITLFTLPHY